MMLALCTATLLSLAPQDPPEALQPLKFLIGTWTGQGKFENGVEYADEHKVDWFQNRQFLKSEYSVKVGEKVVWTATSIIGYDHEKKNLFAIVFAMNGGHSRTDVVSVDKDTYVFEGKAVGPGILSDDRVTNAKIDEDTFSVVVEAKKDGKFAVTGKYVYKRKK